MSIYTRALETATRLLDKYGATMTVTGLSGTTNVRAVMTSLDYNDIPQTLHGRATSSFVTEAASEIQVGDIVSFAEQNSRVLQVSQISPAGTTLVYKIVTGTQ